jgi:membrane protease YdiL (CAAX protease family)
LFIRGLFLRKLEPFYGKFLSNCLIVIVFTGQHLGVTYTRNQTLFLIVVMLLAFAGGTTMQKSDSIWGSILFHAGTDIPIFFAYLFDAFLSLSSPISCRRMWKPKRCTHLILGFDRADLGFAFNTRH